MSCCLPTFLNKTTASGLSFCWTERDRTRSYIEQERGREREGAERERERKITGESAKTRDLEKGRGKGKHGRREKDTGYCPLPENGTLNLTFNPHAVRVGITV